MSELTPEYGARLLRAALVEDLDGGVDVTSVATIPVDQWSTGRFVARNAGTIAGLAIVLPGLAEQFPDATLVPAVADGDRVEGGALLLTVTAPTRALLTIERSALNLLCHLSGIATVTSRWVDAVAGTGAEIRDTRKTTPGLRLAEKYAVTCGGGTNHRMSLSDEALIKDNHIVAAGSITAALTAVREQFPGLACEVECDTLAQVAEAADAGAEMILLDNMDIVTTGEAVRLVAGRSRTEASGNLSLAVARDVALTGVDYLSVGALTHSAPVLDIGLDLDPVPGRSPLMLLAIDVGNTNTVFGLFEGSRLVDHWRISTEARRTGDELGLTVAGLLGDRVVRGDRAVLLLHRPGRPAHRPRGLLQAVPGLAAGDRRAGRQDRRTDPVRQPEGGWR